MQIVVSCVFTEEQTERNGTEQDDMELFQKTVECLQVLVRERPETFRSVPFRKLDRSDK